MPKLSVMVSPELNAIIAKKAAERGQPKTEWVEEQIMATLSGTPGADQRVIDTIVARCDQIETRIFHEHNAVLYLLFETFREAIHASTTGMSGTTKAPPADDAEAEERFRTLHQEAETEFSRRHQSLIAKLQDIRDRAKSKAEEQGQSLASGAGSSEAH